MKNKSPLSVLISLVALVIALGLVFDSLGLTRYVKKVFLTANTADTSTISQPLVSPSPSPQAITVLLSLRYNGESPDTVSAVTVNSGSSVLDVLRQLKQAQLVTKDYSFGTLVESIDGVKNGTNQKYWLYSVNKKEATISASQYMVKHDDQVVWEFKANDQ